MWAPFLYGLTGNLQRGWVAVTDNGAIALRSWDVLTAGGPLVGQATRLGHGVFDAGPLEYWLLALPVHLDPGHGVLWGAALWSMVAGSLAVEAAWSAAGWYAGLGAAGFILGLIVWIPPIAQDPSWNPWIAVMYLTAALAAAWAVMTGHRGWWPVLVISASIAAQAHLMCAIAAAAAVVLALIVGLVDTIRSRAGWRGYRWLIIGVVAGAACWAAPLVQQFTNSQGNLHALLLGNGTPQPRAGLAFGLKALSAAVQPPVYWWQPLRSIRDLGTVGQRSAVAGGIALAVAAAVVVVAIVVLRSRRAAALGGLSLLLSGAVIATYAGVPAFALTRQTATLGSLRYLLTPLYLTGVVTWLTAVSVLALLARRVAARVRDRTPAGPATGSAAGPARITATVRAGTCVTVAALVALACSQAVVKVSHRLRAESIVMKDVTRAASQIRHDLPGQPIALSVRAPTNPGRRQLVFGLVYALRTMGYQAEIGPGWARQLGPQYTHGDEPVRSVTVAVLGSALSVDVSKRTVIAHQEGDPLPGLPLI